MKKRRCVVCGKNKARRICALHNNEMICSLCCAETRNSEDCEGCRYFTTAARYHSSKARKSESKHFMIEINEEVENTVDRALALVEKGDIEKGETMISDLKKDHPLSHVVHYGLGVVHAFKGQNDEAVECFEKATDIFPYFLEAHFNKGVAYKNKLDIGNTVKAFKKVIEIGDPEDSIVKQAGNVIKEMERGMLKTEGIDLETYLECQKRFDEAFSCMEKQEWEKAIDGFKACLIKGKKHPQSYGNMGLCYAQLGQKAEALAAFDKALEIDPTYEPAILNRAIVESLEEGKTLEGSEMTSVEYYKDFSLKKRDLAQYLLEKLVAP